jgi:peptidylprolyl isomerase
MIRRAFLFATLAFAMGSAASAQKIKAVGEASKVEDYLPPPVTPDNTWNLDLTTGGRVVIQLRPDIAPKMVQQIKALTQQGFYNGLTFHRVIEGFMAQGGDPKGTGEGGSTLPDVPAEFNDLPHVRGAVAAARAADENSANSQFYVMLAPNLKLDRHYTVFGRVIAGMPYVDAIQRGEPPANPTRIVQASVGNTPPLSAAQLQPPAPVAAPATLPSGLIGITPATPPRR